MSPIVRGARIGFRVGAWIFVACVIVQVFLAGVGVFSNQADFTLHRQWGYTFGWLAIILLVLAIVGRLPRRAVWGSVLLIVLFTMQSVFVAMRESAPLVAALHPVNALAIFLLSIWLARSAAAWVSPPPTPAAGAV